MASYNWSKVSALSAFGHDITRITRTTTGELIWQKEDPIPEDMLTFTAVGEASTIQLKKAGTPYDVSLEYKVDDGEWKTFAPESTTIELEDGQKAYLRSTVEDPDGTNATPFSKNYTNYYKFSMTGKIAASGNIQYLIDKTGQRTSVPSYCYCYMFLGCTSLTAAPALPATQLANSCYFNMFQSCTSLSAAPQLPASQLADYCYYDMFHGCTSLSAAPELPATQLAEGCYISMFRGCTSLTAAPALPATTLADGCYSGMFSDCTKVNDIYIPNLTESEYNAEKAAKKSGDLGREGQATFHFK